MAFYGYCGRCQRTTQRFIVGHCGSCGRPDDRPEPSVVVCQLDGRVYDEADGPCPDCAQRRDAERYVEGTPQEQEPR